MSASRDDDLEFSKEVEVATSTVGAHSTNISSSKPCLARIENRIENLYRQVSPSFFKADGDCNQPTSQAFYLNVGDEGLLSVSQGSKTTPHASWKLHNTQKELQSSGVFVITVGVCLDLGLVPCEDPIIDSTSKDYDVSHAVIDHNSEAQQHYDNHCEDRKKNNNIPDSFATFVWKRSRQKKGIAKKLRNSAQYLPFS